LKLYSDNRRVVITGLGTINPIGNTVSEFWANLLEGKSGIRLSQKVDLSQYHVKIAGEIDKPDLSEYFPSRKMLKRFDDFIIYGHVAGSQAVKDAGIEIDKAPHRYGSLIGTGDGGLTSQIETITRINETGMATASPFYVINAIPNTATAYLAQIWNLHGPSFSINSACATGNHSIGVAASLIQMGMADAMFAGGSECVVNKAGIAAFGNIMALSTRNDDPETASRPFDVGRNGFVMSEGSGVLCLEELEHAKKRGAHIYAELTGMGFTTDAHDLVAPHPEARGAALAMQIAMEMAELNPEDIGLINAHGTSTPMGDKIEGFAINRALGENYGPKVPVHSTKSMTGHIIGGTSAVEAIAALHTFEKGTAHPSINLFEQDPEINLNIITEPTELPDIKHLMSNAFGFGGHNATLIFSKYEG
jgi:3-oxoacyl-[acyl-carrier-protein] synthase II